MPSNTSSAPVPMIRTRVGNRPSRTKPVRKVPTIAPAVPMADNRPTVEPLVPTDTMEARMIIGATAERTVAGSTKPAPARVTIATRSWPMPTSPTLATIGTDAIAVRPPQTSVGPMSRTGDQRSAAWPPSQAPSEIPARMTPMIPV